MTLFLKVLGWILLGVAAVVVAICVVGFMIGLAEVIRYEVRHRRR